MKAEAAVGKKEHAAANLYDLRKFFETIPLEELQRRAIKWGADLVVIKLVVNFTKARESSL